jgi:hypothetical protein
MYRDYYCRKQDKINQYKRNIFFFKKIFINKQEVIYIEYNNKAYNREPVPEYISPPVGLINIIKNNRHPEDNNHKTCMDKNGFIFIKNIFEHFYYPFKL